jgi:thiol-activated cytolysin
MKFLKNIHKHCKSNVNRLNNPYLKTTLVLLFSLAIIGCSKDESPNNDNGNANTIALGGEFPDFPQSKMVNSGEPEEIDPEDVDSEDGQITTRYKCERVTLSITDGNANFPMFNPNAEVIYPGNLIQGATRNNATPSIIPVGRADGTISYNLNNGNLQSFFYVDEVKKSSIQNAMNQIIDGAEMAGSVLPSNFNLEITQVESEQALAYEMGLDIETFTASASANLSFSQNVTYNRTLVKLTQQYYTMSFDIPTNGLDGFFAESVTSTDLEPHIGSGNPAAFISSVTYGRIFYMLIESSSTRQEMQTQLEAAYDAFGSASVSGSLDTDSMQALENLSIKVVAYGGDASTTPLTGPTNINQLADQLQESTDIKAGLPLSYTLRSVENPAIVVGTNISTEYDIVQCDLIGELPPGQYADLVDLFEDGIGAMGSVSGSDVLIFNKAGDKYAWYNGILPGVFRENGVRKIYELQDPNGPLGGIELESVGAALQVLDGAGGDFAIYIFSSDGFQFQSLNINTSLVPGNALPSGPIGFYATGGDVSEKVFSVNNAYGDAGGSGLLINNGIGAGVNVGSPNMALFERDGTQHQYYDANEGSNGFLSNLTPNTSWYDNQGNEGNVTLFNKVDAATKYGLNGGSAKYIFINGDGDLLFEWISTVGSDTFFGPWAIN